MNAFHSNWTKPFFLKHSGDYFIEDFELLTTILSALKWQQFNGSIKMVTDLTGYAYYKSLGLEGLWDLGIDCSLEVDSEIDPYTFWAAGKLYALQKQENPCVMLDTDFIVWDSVQQVLLAHKLAVIHREAINEGVYPSKERFLMEEGYEWKAFLDWKHLPCNTAFTYIGDDVFKALYTEEATQFMKAAKGRDPLTYMVFAEQRLFAMCAAYEKTEIFSFLEEDKLFNKDQTLFTHIWGHKAQLRNNEQERKQFCKRCVKRIIEDFPHMLKTLTQIESLREYMV